MAKKRVTRNNKKKTNRSRPRGPRTKANGVRDYARMLADPCTASLVGPEYGSTDSGYLARLNTFLDYAVGTTFTEGYAVWFPDHHGGLANGNSGNGSLFVYQTTSGFNTPGNTTALPLGAGVTSTATNGRFFADPAHSWVASDTVADARTAAGCIQFLYTGRMDSLSGRVGTLTGIPKEALLNGGVGALPPSVNDMFRCAKEIQRTPGAILDNKFRPGPASEFFRTVGRISASTELGTDGCYLIGSAGTRATELAGSLTSGSDLGIGFCWSGLSPDSTFTLSAHKVVEWRPQMTSGMVSVPPSKGSAGVNVVQQAVTYLDRAMPGWETRAMSMAAGAAESIASIAFGGAANLVTKFAPMLL